MIETSMNLYNFYLYDDIDEYGQPTIDGTVKGKIKMAINTTSQSVQDNINYKGAQYMGLTLDDDINDKYVIDYNGEKLKVLYVNPKGRYNQVFLELIE